MNVEAIDAVLTRKTVPEFALNVQTPPPAFDAPVILSVYESALTGARLTSSLVLNWKVAVLPPLGLK